jgi:hypothetical protein
MRTVLTLLLCLPLLAPPGVCACGAASPVRSKAQCGCCHSHTRKKCPAKPAAGGQPRSHDDHAPTCPAHPAASVSLAKALTPVLTIEASAGVSPTIPAPTVDDSRPPLPDSDSSSDPPLYLHAPRC